MYFLVNYDTGEDMACSPDKEFIESLQMTYIEDGVKCYIQHISDDG